MVELDILQYPGMHIFTAECGGGKSYLTKYLAYSDKVKKKYDYALVLTMTPDDYTDWFPNEFIHVPTDIKYTDGLIAKIFRKQEAFKAAGTPRRLLIIFDDCLGAVNFRSRYIIQLTTRYRHYNICLVIAVQNIHKVDPTIRSCAYSACIFPLSTKASIRAAWEDFGQRLFKNEREFSTYLEQSTTNHHFLYVNKRAKTNKFSDIYRSIRAPGNLPQFQLRW